MSSEESVDYVVPPERALQTVPGKIPARVLWLSLGAIGVGLAAFFLAGSEKRAWQATWSNFLFWTALSQAGVIFGAGLQAAKGHWGKGFRRIAEAAAAFLPASLVIFFLLWFGADQILPWIQDQSAHVNRTWLQKGDLFVRNGALLLVLYGLSFWFLKTSLRPDAELLVDELGGWRRSLVKWISSGWRGAEEEVERSRNLLGKLSPALILLWAAIFSLLSYDLAMSLMPGFLSFIWGPYYFIGGWLCMLALVAIMANRYHWEYGLSDQWDRWQFHDLGKLLFAFTIFWAYLWWSQFLVIWYGNIPYETVFFEQRTTGGFGPLYTLQMILIFGLPFVLLLFRKPKMNPGYLAFVSVLTLGGFWLERFLLVAPSTWQGTGVPIGWTEVGITVGFLGVFSLCYALYSSTFPKVPIRETLIEGTASTGP